MLAVKDPTMTGEGEEEESGSYAKLARKWGVDQGGEEGAFVDVRFVPVLLTFCQRLLTKFL